MLIHILIVFAMMSGSAAIGYKVADRNAEKVLIDTEIERYAQGFSDGVKARVVHQRQDAFKAENPDCYDGDEFMMTDSCLELWDKETEND